MVPSAYPDPKRLVYRIRTAITGESTGLETAKLAWQYAEACDRANRDLHDAAQLLEAGDTAAGLLLAEDLLDTAEILDHSQRNAWEQRCASFGWRSSKRINLETLKGIRVACAELEDSQDLLEKSYKSAQKAGHLSHAYQIAGLQSRREPKDPELRQALAQQEGLLFNELSKRLQEANSQLIPEESADSLVAKYERIGLPILKAEDQTIQAAYSTAATAHQRALAQRAQKVVEKAQDEVDGNQWLELEAAYLECEYELSIHQAHGKLCAKLMGEFDEVATRLARLRAQHEAEISIRIAIAQLTDGHTHQGKPVELANRIAKLRSTETQAARAGYRIPPELKKQIDAACSKTRGHKRYLYGAAAAIALVLVASLVVLNNSKQKRRAETEERALALSEIQESQRQGNAKSASAMLAKWGATLEDAEPGSELALSAQDLEQWLESQRSLEEAYRSSVADLETVISSRDAQANAEAVRELATRIQSERKDLAPDLGSTAQSQFELLVERFERERRQARERDQASLEKLEKELALAVANAARAQARDEFDRISAAADTRMRAIGSLLEDTAFSLESSHANSLVSESSQSLAATSKQWDELEAAWTHLGKTRKLAPYLAQLERLSSLGKLAASDRDAIEKTLRQRRVLEDLTEQGSLPHGAIRSSAFPQGVDYLGEPVAASKAEKRFIEQLQDKEELGSVYMSRVQYFEGTEEPAEDYLVYLAEPVAKSSSETREQGEGAASVAITFQAREFDEFGLTRSEPTHAPFISSDNGALWGFFYKPSSLTPESSYYNSTIRNTLSILLAGGSRLTIAQLVEDLDTQDQLSPLFRSYWQREMIRLASIDPWKWGLALSPALKERAARIDALESAPISDRSWLSTIEQGSPSLQHKELLDGRLQKQPSKEIAALARLHQIATEGSYRLVGFAQADKRPRLFEPPDKGAALVSLLSDTGQPSLIDEQSGLLPHAPILQFVLSVEDSPEELLASVAQESGIDLEDPRYKSLLPKLFQ